MMNRKRKRTDEEAHALADAFEALLEARADIPATFAGVVKSLDGREYTQPVMNGRGLGMEATMRQYLGQVPDGSLSVKARAELTLWIAHPSDN